MPTAPLDPQVVLDIDPYLKPHIPAIIQRYNSYKRWKDLIELHEGGYDKFTKGYKNFGLNVGPNNEVYYREWAPNAQEAYLIGEFSMLDFTTLGSSS
jgi:1,4-alpha-glucan branching enzyme